MANHGLAFDIDIFKYDQNFAYVQNRTGANDEKKTCSKYLKVN